MAAAKKKTQTKDDHPDTTARILNARENGYRDGVIEGLASAIRIMLATDRRDAGEDIRAELARRFPGVPVPDLDPNVDRDMLNTIYRGDR